MRRLRSPPCRARRFSEQRGDVYGKKATQARGGVKQTEESCTIPAPDAPFFTR